MTARSRRGPYNARPSVLDDPEWLTKQYATKSTPQIAAELGINKQMVLAALKRHGIPIRDRSHAQRNRNPRLHDIEWLEQRIADASVVVVADELGVTKHAVHAVLARNGGNSAHRYNRGPDIVRPDDLTLRRWWESERTIAGVARCGEVSVNTAAVWLASIGIFRNDTPAISRADLEAAIVSGDSIAVIRRRHHVTGRTVVVELHRHGLVEAHRRRHMRKTP